MKKLLTGIIALALVISVCSTTAFAAGHGHGRRHAAVNNDVVCDYCTTFCQFVDDNEDGICDNCGSDTCKKCTGYVDANGDGICDNYGSCVCGNGAGFTDADGDGVCDNLTACTSQNGSGLKQGHCGGHARHGRHCR